MTDDVVVHEPEFLDEFEFRFAGDESPEYNAIFYILKNPKTGRLFIPEMLTMSKDEYNSIAAALKHAREIGERPPVEVTEYEIIELALLGRATRIGFISDDREVKDFKERTLPRIKIEKEIRKLEKLKVQATDIDEANMYQWEINRLNGDIEKLDKTDEDLLEEFLSDMQVPPEKMLEELNRRKENYTLQIGTNEKWKIMDEVTLMKTLRQHFKIINPRTGKMDIAKTEEAIIEAMPQLKTLPVSDLKWEEIQNEINEELKSKRKMLTEQIRLKNAKKIGKSNDEGVGISGRCK